MMDRRGFICTGGAILLAACSPQVIDPEVAQSIWVQDIAVDVSNFRGVTGRNITRSPSQVKADIEAALGRSVLGRGAPGGTPVRLSADIEAVRLASPGQAFLVGGVSVVSSKVSIMDIETGTLVESDVRLASGGQGYALGGAIGAASRGAPEADYANVIALYGQDVARSLLGNNATRRVGQGRVSGPGATSTPARTNADRPAIWAL